MDFKIINMEFSICKVKKITDINYEDEYCFIGKTDEEISLVCSSEYVPVECIECDGGWRAFRIQGVLDFTLIGIISKISTILAENKVGIFVVSTYNTDYILVKKENWDLTLDVLAKENYKFIY